MCVCPIKIFRATEIVYFFSTISLVRNVSSRNDRRVLSLFLSSPLSLPASLLSSYDVRDIATIIGIFLLPLYILPCVSLARSDFVEKVTIAVDVIIRGKTVTTRRGPPQDYSRDL